MALYDCYILERDTKHHLINQSITLNGKRIVKHFVPLYLHFLKQSYKNYLLKSCYMYLSVLFYFFNFRCTPHLSRYTWGRKGRKRPCPSCRNRSSGNPVLSRWDVTRRVDIIRASSNTYEWMSYRWVKGGKWGVKHPDLHFEWEVFLTSP